VTPAQPAIVKAHAFGNDFVLIDETQPGVPEDRPALARALCERHRGVGADGLICYTPTTGGASMRLLNADGSRSEVSGNGVRCLAAWLAGERDLTPGSVPLVIETEAGPKTLELIDHDDGRWTFRAAMGLPEEVTQVPLRVGAQEVVATTMRVGNPQCVVLGEVTLERLHTLAAALAVHEHFPEGTNVELAQVRSADRPHPDLGAGRGSDRGVGHGRVRGGRGGHAVRRCRSGSAGRVSRRAPACGMDGRRSVPDRLGRDHPVWTGVRPPVLNGGLSEISTPRRDAHAVFFDASATR
jgi:diaminopimelate epimerase